MSYIDLFKHNLLGHFLLLPIYLPLENSNGEEFSFTTENLVIGGGSGEHPAIVIHNLDKVVAMYLLHCLITLEENGQEIPQEIYDQLYDLANDKRKVLEFCNWSIDTYRNFAEMVDKYALNPAQCSIFDGAINYEDYLASAIGEFLYHSIPEIVPNFEKFKQINVGDYARFFFHAVSCPPPNYRKHKPQLPENDFWRDKGSFYWNYTK